MDHLLRITRIDAMGVFADGRCEGTAFSTIRPCPMW